MEVKALLVEGMKPNEINQQVNRLKSPQSMTSKTQLALSQSSHSKSTNRLSNKKKKGNFLSPSQSNIKQSYYNNLQSQTEKMGNRHTANFMPTNET